MAEIQTILQVAQLVAIVSMAAGVFVRLGRIHAQMDRTVEDVGEVRRDVRHLSDQWTDLRTGAERHTARIDEITRRLDKVESTLTLAKGALA